MTTDPHNGENRAGPHTTDHTTDNATDDMLARLLHAAGRREQPPPEAYRQTLEVASTALQTKLRRRRRRQFGAWAAAATLLIASGGLFVNLLPSAPPAPVAHMQRIIGTAEVHSAALDQWTTLQDESQPFAAGSRLRTSVGSRAGLWLGEGVSLRLAESSEIILLGANEIELLDGKLYVDTGGRDAGESVHVRTAAGTAYDIGTQFEVLFREQTYRLRVREGQVMLTQGAQQLSSRAGEQLLIDTRGELHHGVVQRDDEDWQWVESLAPAPDIDGEPLGVLLEWVARETGRAIRFNDATVEASAARTILHGSIRNLAPLEALAVTLATTDLDYSIDDDGTILIGPRTQQ